MRRAVESEEAVWLEVSLDLRMLGCHLGTGRRKGGGAAVSGGAPVESGGVGGRGLVGHHVHVEVTQNDSRCGPGGEQCSRQSRPV